MLVNKFNAVRAAIESLDFNALYPGFHPFNLRYIIRMKFVWMEN